VTACKFVATDQPRVIPGRHAYGCAAGAIAGLPMDQEPTESLNGAQIGADGFACVGCLPCDCEGR
jgi:hypothetical protein